MTQTPEQIARGLSVPQRQAIFPGPGNPEYACGAEAVGAGNSRGERNMSPEQHADAILRAAGSSLANYTMPGTRAAILAAVQAVLLEGVRIGIEAAAESVAFDSTGMQGWQARDSAQDRVDALDPATILARRQEGGGA